ncbi:hypothetical protein ABBQ32_001972 [Trebouxia sp. C0010 RCD-2024]
MHGLQNHEHKGSPQHHSAPTSSPGQAASPRPPSQKGFADVAQQHLAAVVGQILKVEGAQDASVWQPIITRLALEAAYAVLPSALAAFGVSDPRFYIKVKRVADVGAPSDSMVVHGLVFRKNVVHKLMRSHIAQPRIMMLGSMLEYHRTTGKLSSFDTLLEQEHEHLRITVERVADYKPDVLLVEKSVARYAQELLLQKGISVVLNVKRSLLNRLARCTEAQVASSVEDLNNHCIAFCKEFHVEVLKPSRTGMNKLGSTSSKSTEPESGSSQCSTPTTPLRVLRRSSTSAGSGGASFRHSGSGPRTLMFFKGCPRPLGCTVLLKGAPADQLVLLKKVTKFAVFAAYAGRLETAFLTDEVASANAVLGCSTAAPASPKSPPGTVIQPDDAAASAALQQAPKGSGDDAVGAGRRIPGVEASKEVVGRGEELSAGANLHVVAAESAASTAHVRLQKPILSISPHVTHLSTHHPSHRSTSAPASRPLLGYTASGSEQYTHSMPDRLHPSDSTAQGDGGPSPQPAPPPVHDTTPRASMQQSSSLSSQEAAAGSARAQRQLFTNLSDQARPSSTQGPEPPTPVPGSSNLSPQQQGAADWLPQAEAGSPQETSHPSLAEVYSRQRLFVCKMCRNPVKGLLCEPSSMQRIDYYQGNDTPLASFLAGAGQLKCLHAACGDGVTAHLRTFLHSKGRVTLSVSQTPAGRELPGSDKGQVWFWARPSKVDAEEMQAVRRVLLSPEALCLSLGHFLELSFGAPHLRVHGRSLHGGFVRYFGTGTSILCFQYEAISPNTVMVPSRRLRLQRDVQHSWLHREVDELAQEAAAAFGVLQSALHSQLGSALPSSEQASSGSTPQIASSAADLLKAAEEERTAFDSMLQDVASLLAPDSDTWLEPDAPSDTPIDPTAQEGQQRVPAFVTMLWEVGRLRRSLTVLVMTWAATLHDPVVYARPMSHSHSVPNSLHSLDQGARQLSTDSLPNMACEEEAPLQVGPRHAAPQGAELAQQALQDPGSSAASSEKDSVDDRQQGMSQDGSEPDAVGAHEAGLGAVSSEEQACPVVLGSTPPVLAGGIVAQTILNLERQRAERSPPTRMNAAAAARRFVASALEQRARTLQWLNSSRLSADETLLTVGRPISQLAYVEVHLHVQPDNHVRCELIRVSQHSKALQALGLQDASPAKAATKDTSTDTDTDTQPAEAPAQSPGSPAAVQPAGKQAQPTDQHSSVSQRSEAVQKESLVSQGPFGADQQQQRHQQQQQRQQVPALPAEAARESAGDASAALPAGLVQRRLRTLSSDMSPRTAREKSTAGHHRHAAFLVADWQEGSRETSEQLPHVATSGSAPPQRGVSDASALISHFDDWATVLEPEAESSLSRRGSGKLEGLEPDALRSTVDGLLKRQPGPSKLQPNAPSSLGLATNMQSSPSLSQQQMSQIISAGSFSHRQAQLQPNTIPLSHGKVELHSRALLAIGAGDIVVPVFDDEPTSIIAYALCSRLYQTHLKDSQEKMKSKAAAARQAASQPSKAGNQREAGLRAAMMAPLSSSLGNQSKHQGAAQRVHLPGSRVDAQPVAAPSMAAQSQGTDVMRPEPPQHSAPGAGWPSTYAADPAVNSPRATWAGVANAEGVREAERAATEGPDSRPDGFPVMQALLCEERMDFQHVFEDSAPGMPWARVSFQVTAYYAPQFEALREMVVEGGALVFTACLSRCKKWLSRGGKSAVYFAKTQDERYVVKQLTRSEKQSFLDFAPAYFRYLAGAFKKDQETCLAKVLGLYQVSKKNIGAAAGSALSSGQRAQQMVAAGSHTSWSCADGR